MQTQRTQKKIILDSTFCRRQNAKDRKMSPQLDYPKTLKAVLLFI
jgi:hypothetical protein